LATEYQKEHEKLSYGDFKDWLQAIEYAYWANLVKDKSVDLMEYYYNEINVRTQISEQTNLILEFDLLDYNEIVDIHDHDLMIASYKGEF
jgi:hypothetical protein